MRDLCDVVYVLHVERLERQVLAERQVAVAVLAAGGEGVDIPTLPAALAEFEAALAAEPVPESPTAQLLRELGV